MHKMCVRIHKFILETPIHSDNTDLHPSLLYEGVVVVGGEVDDDEVVDENGRWGGCGGDGGCCNLW
jgi:hypothetical protein